MRNKNLKVFVSLLVAFVFLMSTVMAAPAGVYLGGTVNKYYTISQFQASATKVTEMNTAGLANVKYVHNDGKIAAANTLAGGTPLMTALKAMVNGDLGNSYTQTDGTTMNPNPAPTLAVESVSAINTTTVKVVYNTTVTAAAAAKTNYTLSKGTLESATKTGEKEVTLTVAGLTYGDSVTVTVVAPAHTANVKVPAVNELYEMKVISAEANNTIKSDGASMTMLTAQIIEKATNQPVKRDAQIQFTATLGSLSQPQVALQDGKATTQLRSISSPTSVTSVVTAVVASAPGAEQYVGLTGQLIVNFTPSGEGSGTSEMISAVSAGSDQGDRFFVKFSGNITAANYKAVVTKTGVGAWTGAPFGVQYVSGGVARNIAIKDVYNLTDNTLMFVLDTDSTTAPASVRPTTTMLDASYAGGATKNFLRDNVNHTIVFPANITGYVINSSNITFMMSDVTKPFVYGVEATDNMNVKVRLSEAVAEDLSEGLALGLNGRFSIDGKQLRYNAAPTAGDIATAQDNNELIVTELKIGSWTSREKEQANDASRNMVYITIHKDFKLATGTHGIQIANVGDWAGMTDAPQNIVTTQTFNFTVSPDTGVPTATVVSQSPEQWLITFNKNVDSVTGKNISDAFKLYTAEGYAAATKVALAMNVNSAAGDYVITPVDADGMAVTGKGNTGVNNRYAPTDKISGHDRFLVEFVRDWAVKQQGQVEAKDNYWKSGLNPYKVVLNNLESQTGLKISETVQELTEAYDGTSPEISEALDLYVKSPDKAFRALTAAQISSTGKYVFVKMSEPVQMVTVGAPIPVAVSNPVTPNLEQFKPNVAYNVTNGLPVPTFRFVKGDKVVIGTVSNLAEDDQTYVIQPLTQLEAGTWTLYIEQISDDHGNTSKTISKEVVVPQGTAVTTNTKVAWIGFDNNPAAGVNQYDYLYIKYTTVMDAYAANGVDATTNYKFRGYDLPAGSQIFRGIDGITDNWDGVTIRMPKDAWNGIDGLGAAGTQNYTTNVSVASNFKSATGESLSGPYQVEITDAAGLSAADNDGVGVGNANKLEAVYKNTSAASVSTFGDQAVLYATANDTGVNPDGKIDQVVVTFAGLTTSAIPATAKLLVNNVEYTVAALVPAGSPTATFNVIAANAIAGTGTTTLKLATLSNEVLVNTGFIYDAARPVIESAAVNASGRLAITFSEKITVPATPPAVTFGVYNGVALGAGAGTGTLGAVYSVNNNIIEYVVGTGFVATDHINVVLANVGNVTDVVTPANNSAVKATNVPVTIPGGGAPGVVVTGVTATSFAAPSTVGKAAVLGVNATATIGASAIAVPNSAALNGYTIATAQGALVAGAETATLNATTKTITVTGDFAGNVVTAANFQTAIRSTGIAFTALGLNTEATALGNLTVTTNPGALALPTTGMLVNGVTAVAEALNTAAFTVLTGANTTGTITATFTPDTSIAVPVPITTAAIAVVAGDTAATVAGKITAALNATGAFTAAHAAVNVGGTTLITINQTAGNGAAATFSITIQ